MIALRIITTRRRDMKTQFVNRKRRQIRSEPWNSEKGTYRYYVFLKRSLKYPGQFIFLRSKITYAYNFKIFPSASRKEVAILNRYNSSGDYIAIGYWSILTLV